MPTGPGTWIFHPLIRHLSRDYDIYVRIEPSGRPALLDYDASIVEDHSQCHLKKSSDHNKNRVMVKATSGQLGTSHTLVDVYNISVYIPTKCKEWVVQIHGENDDIGRTLLVSAIPPPRGGPRKIGVTFPGECRPREFIANHFTRITKKI